MGRQMSPVERGVYGCFKSILTDQEKFSKKGLKSMVMWILKNFLDASVNKICKISFGDSGS